MIFVLSKLKLMIFSIRLFLSVDFSSFQLQQLYFAILMLQSTPEEIPTEHFNAFQLKKPFHSKSIKVNRSKLPMDFFKINSSRSISRQSNGSSIEIMKFNNLYAQKSRQIPRLREPILTEKRSTLYNKMQQLEQQGLKVNTIAEMSMGGIPRFVQTQKIININLNLNSHRRTNRLKDQQYKTSQRVSNIRKVSQNYATKPFDKKLKSKLSNITGIRGGFSQINVLSRQYDSACQHDKHNLTNNDNPESTIDMNCTFGKGSFKKSQSFSLENTMMIKDHNQSSTDSVQIQEEIERTQHCHEIFFKKQNDQRSTQESQIFQYLRNPQSENKIKRLTDQQKQMSRVTWSKNKGKNVLTANDKDKRIKYRNSTSKEMRDKSLKKELNLPRLDKVLNF